MSHEPTFKVSPSKRPLYQRLTPVAWLVIAAGVLAALYLGVGLVNKLQDDEDTPLVLPTTMVNANDNASSAAAAVQPTQPATVQPTQEPPPAPTLQPTDTSAPPTPAPTATELAFAPDGAWWVTEMACNEAGECMPPDEVADEIIAAFWEWRTAIPFYYYELDMTPEQLEYHYIGTILDLQLEFISMVAETGAMWDGQTIVKEFDYEIRTPYIVNCTTDGLTCLLGEGVQGNLVIHEYDLSVRQIVNSIENPQDKQYEGANIWRFQYDLENGKWKVEKYYDWISAPSQ